MKIKLYLFIGFFVLLFLMSGVFAQEGGKEVKDGFYLEVFKSGINEINEMESFVGGLYDGLGHDKSKYLDSLGKIKRALYVVDEIDEKNMNSFVEQKFKDLKFDTEGVSALNFLLFYSIKQKELRIAYAKGCIYDKEKNEKLLKESIDKIKSADESAIKNILTDLQIQLYDISHEKYLEFLSNEVFLCSVNEENNLNQEVEIRFSKEFIKKSIEERKFVPKEPFNIFDSVQCQTNFAPQGDAKAFIREKDDLTSIYIFNLPKREFKQDSESGVYYASLIYSDNMKSRLVESISKGAEIYCEVDNIKSRSAPMSNCVQVYGKSDAKYKIVGVLGKSAAEQTRNLINKESWLYSWKELYSNFRELDEYSWIVFQSKYQFFDNGIGKYQPFKEYSEDFAFYSDLKIIDDSSMGLRNNEFFDIGFEDIPNNSSCFGGRVYTFYNGRTYNAYTRLNAKTLFINIIKQTRMETFMHEMGHAFVALHDEYYSETQLKSILENPIYNNSQEVLINIATSGELLKNCVKTVNWPDKYGKTNLNYPGCGAFLKGFYFPSKDSMMNLNSNLGFNTISCGYILQSINGGGNINDYWEKCSNYETGTIDTSCGNRDDCVKIKNWDLSCVKECNYEHKCIRRDEIPFIFQNHSKKQEDIKYCNFEGKMVEKTGWECVNRVDDCYKTKRDEIGYGCVSECKDNKCVLKEGLVGFKIESYKGSGHLGICDKNGTVIKNEGWECSNDEAYFGIRAHCEYTKGYNSDCTKECSNNKCIPDIGKEAKEGYGSYGICNGEGKINVNPEWKCLINSDCSYKEKCEGHKCIKE